MFNGRILMAADISESLKNELHIIEVEAEFLGNKPLSKPRKAWSVITVAGFCVVFALLNWRSDNMALSVFLGLVAVLQLVEYQSSVQAHKLYESGSEIIRFYKRKCESRT
jgi:hypothetical protein